MLKKFAEVLDKTYGLFKLADELTESLKPESIETPKSTELGAIYAYIEYLRQEIVLIKNKIGNEILKIRPLTLKRLKELGLLSEEEYNKEFDKLDPKEK